MPTKRISDFWYRWPQVKSFLRPPHYKSMIKKINSVTFTLAQAYFSGIASYRRVVDNSSTNLHCLLLERSFEVNRGDQLWFANNFWSKRVDTWDWCQYVRLGQAHRLICNMTHFGHHVTLAWLDLTWLELWTWPFKVVLYIVTNDVLRLPCISWNCA